MRLLLWSLLEKQVVTVTPQETIAEALVKLGDYTTIPVVTKNREYLGVINKTDIFNKMIYNGLNPEETKVEEVILSYNFISSHETTETLVDKLQNARFLFLPLLDTESEKPRFMGIIPNKKLLELFGNLIGKNKKGVTLNALVCDSVGQIYKISKIFRQEGINIISLSVVDLEVMSNKELIFKLDMDEKELPHIRDLLRKHHIDVR